MIVVLAAPHHGDTLPVQITQPNIGPFFCGRAPAVVRQRQVTPHQINHKTITKRYVGELGNA